MEEEEADAAAASASASAGLNDLPEAVLLHIFGFLSVGEVLRVNRVCKFWRRLARDRCLWKNVDLTPYKLDARTLRQVLRRHGSAALHSLSLRSSLLHRQNSRRHFLTDAVLREVGRSSPSLHTLDVSHANLRHLSFAMLPASLRTLRLSMCEMPRDWLSRCDSVGPRLTCLEVANVPSFSNDALVDAARGLPLTALSLSLAYRVTDNGLHASCENFGALQRLRLSQGSITDLGLHHICRHMPALRKLELFRSNKLTDAGLACFGRSLPLLSTLVLSGCAFTAKGIGQACRELPALRRLDLAELQLTEQEAEQIRRTLPKCNIVLREPPERNPPGGLLQAQVFVGRN
ncbi:unnamed protein product [Lampetra planeri]